MKTDHLLIIRFSALGDVAMTVPVVYSLAIQYPHLRITVLSRPFARIFFEHLAPNVGFMELDMNTEGKNLKGLNALYRRLVAKKFTAVADFHDVLRSKYLRLRFLLGGFRTEHIDKHRDGKRRLVQQKGKQLVQQPTSFKNYADVLARLGYPVDIHFKSIFPEGGGDLTTLNIGIWEKKEGERWIGIAPFAAHKGKIYPIEKTEEVIRLITEKEKNCRIFLFGGGKEEKQQLDRLADNYPQCMNASAALSGLGQELILMSHLDVMLSMDSANMHLASLTGTPVISVWGATHPYAGFMGWNQSAENAIQVPLDCRPCSIYGNKPCLRGDYACMQLIDPQWIADRIIRLIH